MYCPVVLISPAFSFGKTGSNAVMRPSCCQQYCTQSGLSIAWESICGQCRDEILVCESLFFQNHSKFIAFNISESVSHVRTKECNTRFFICKVNLKLLRSLTVIQLSLWLCFSWSRVFMASTLSGSVKTGFRGVKFRRLWNFCIKNHELSLCAFLVHWRVEYFRNCNLPLTFQIQWLR